MKNPLDTTDVFSLELMNPNPTSSKTKDGPKYRVSFEMKQDDWQMFMDANTNGMVLEMQGRVAESGSHISSVEARTLDGNEQALSQTLKGGPLSIEAAQWCMQDDANQYARSKGYNIFKEMIYHYCMIESRRELDHNRIAAHAWLALKNDCHQWSETHATSTKAQSQG